VSSLKQGLCGKLQNEFVQEALGTVHKKCTHVLDRNCHSETFLRRTGPGEGNEMTRSDLRKSVEGNVEHVGYINSVKLL